MRKIRNAAVAGLAAVSLIAGTVSAATADENEAPKDEQNSSAAMGSSEKGEEGKEEGGSASLGSSDKDKKDDDKDSDKDNSGAKNTDGTTGPLDQDIENENNSSNSSVWGNRYDGDNEVTGRNLLGLEKNFSDQPAWAQIWYVVTVLGVLGSLAGLVALPIANQAKAQGFIV